MDINERIRALDETRNRVWNEASNWLQDLPKGEEMSGEQRSQWDRYNERIDALASERDTLAAAEVREREAGQLREAQGLAFGAVTDEATERRSANQQLAAWMRGEQRMDATDFETSKSVNGVYANVARVARERELIRQGASPEELRTLAWDTGSVASAVPTTLDRSLYEVLEANIAALRLPTTRITTESGNPMDFGKVTAHGIATQVAGQGTTIGGTDPTLGKLSLTPTKFGEIINVNDEVATDNGVDIVSFVARDIGRAVGRRVNEHIIASIVAGAVTGSGGTVATGGSVTSPTYEKLVDLEFSVNDAYRNSPNAAWLMNDRSAGILRKLRDGAGGTEGSPMWQPSVTAGISGLRAPDRLFGYPVFTDPNVASLASNAKILFFGDWSAYYFRTVGDLLVERNDAVGFREDQIAFRGKWRAAGGYQDLTAINLMKASA